MSADGNASLSLLVYCIGFRFYEHFRLLCFEFPPKFTVQKDISEHTPQYASFISVPCLPRRNEAIKSVALKISSEAQIKVNSNFIEFCIFHLTDSINLNCLDS